MKPNALQAAGADKNEEDMELSPRHRLILKALIDDFVAESRPVGSKTLSEKYDLGISPATVRNVFQDLEEAGLICSLHHSGGRVPTDKGYRLYVDNLLILYELTILEKQRIQEEYLKNQMKLDQILFATCRVLAHLSNSAGLVLSPGKNFDILKHVELIHVSGEEILMILVTRSGQVLNRNIFLNVNIAQESLYQISKFLNQFLKGMELDKIPDVIELLKSRDDAPTDFYKTADLIRVGFLPDQTETELHIDGFQNLVNSLQGREREKVEQILFLLEDKKLLKEFFSKYIHNDGVSTYIAEPDDEIFAGMSVIATNYRLGEKKIGSIGILGPNRMNYNKGLSLVEFTSKLLSEMITRMSK